MAACHIRKRTLGDGTSRYDVRYRRGGRYWPVEHAGTFRNLKDARIRRDLVTGWLAANQDPKVMLQPVAKAKTLLAVGDDWLASKQQITDSTRGNYRQNLYRAVDLIGDVPVDEITPDTVRRYIAGLSVGPASVKNALITLRAVLDHADLPSNPARHRSVEAPRVARRELQPPDAHELLAILTHLHPRYRPILLLMEQTGLRVSETLGLEPHDIDRTEIRVRREVAKGNRPRTTIVPLWLSERVEPPFPGVTRSTMWNHLAAAADSAGVKRYGSHQWRHRRATLWHRQGVPAVEVARRLGHAKVSMTLDTYTHARPVTEADAQTLASLLM